MYVYIGLCIVVYCCNIYTICLVSTIYTPHTYIVYAQNCYVYTICIQIRDLSKQRWIRKFPPLAVCGDETYRRIKQHGPVCSIIQYSTCICIYMVYSAVYNAIQCVIYVRYLYDYMLHTYTHAHTLRIFHSVNYLLFIHLTLMHLYTHSYTLFPHMTQVDYFSYGVEDFALYLPPSMVLYT